MTQPFCSKCKSTGRTCDGYHNTAPVLKVPSPGETTRPDIRDSISIASANGHGNWHPNSEQHATVFHTALTPLMVLPATADPVQTCALSFFQAVSIHHLNQYQPGDSWQWTLLYFAQTVPAVRHAAVALALMQQACLHREVGTRNLPSAQNQGADAAALMHYNKAIQLVLHQGGIVTTANVSDDKEEEEEERKAITLLVCHLFTCFEHVAGHDVQALAHLRGGVQLVRAVDGNDGYDDGVHGRVRRRRGGVAHLMEQVTRQIRRLDWQAATFLIDWAPATTTTQDGYDDLCAYASLDEAADALQPLIARVMMLRNTSQTVHHPVSSPTPSDQISLKHSILAALDRWSRLFEAMLQADHHHSSVDVKTQRLISLLRLQHSIAWILLSAAFAPDKEMEYDKFLAHFQRCVALAEHVVAFSDHQQGSPLASTFTPDLGIVPVLYTIGVKCRHPTVRRDVVRILKTAAVREALWDSATAARIVERVMEIEEGCCGGEDGVPRGRSMNDISASQRVEDVSWAHVGGGGGGSVARLDLQYTLCGQEGVHTESLLL